MTVRLILDVAGMLQRSNAMWPYSLISRYKNRTKPFNRLFEHNIEYRFFPRNNCQYKSLSNKVIANRCIFSSAIIQVCRSYVMKESSRINYISQNLRYSTSSLRTLSMGFSSSMTVPSEEKSLHRYYSNDNSNQNPGSTKRLINQNLGIKNKEFVDHVLRNNQKKIRLTKLKLKKSGKIILEDIKESKSKMKERMEEIIERENIWTIPNMLTVLRIAMSPFLGYLICQNNYELALGLVIFAGFTDFLDGIIARSFKNQASKLGSFLDPMADKVLIATLFLTLTLSGNIPIPLTVLIIARDLFLVGAGFYIRYQSLPPPKTLSRYLDVSHATAELAPTQISKINTLVQLGTVFTTLAAVSFGFLDHPAVQGLFWLTAGTTVASAASYMISKDTYKILKRKK